MKETFSETICIVCLTCLVFDNGLIIGILLITDRLQISRKLKLPKAICQLPDMGHFRYHLQIVTASVRSFDKNKHLYCFVKELT